MEKISINRFFVKDFIPWNMNAIQKDMKNQLIRAIEEGIIKLDTKNKCFCNNEEFILLASIDRFGLEFNSKLCTRCGLINTDPVISAESIQLYYQKYYHSITFGNYDTVGALYKSGQGKKIFNLLQEHLTTKSLKVLEIGSGTGNVLIEFKKNAESHDYDIQLYGTEYNLSLINKSEEDGIIMSSLSLEEFTKNSKGKFDVVILSHVLEHFLDIRLELSYLKQITHNETLFYVEVPGILELKNMFVYDLDFLKYLIHAHIHNFSLDSLTNTMNSQGFQLVYGNEKIESIFIKSDKINEIRYESYETEEIINYLLDLEINKAHYLKKHYKNTLKFKIKNILYRILKFTGLKN